MLRLGERYRHLIHDAGCGCANPEVQKASRRLERYSRRHFLAGMGSVALAGTIPGSAFAQEKGAPSRLLFTRARVFDGISSALQHNVQVLVEGNRITAIDAAANPAPADTRVIDCGDRVLMPGMIDAHWHTIFAAVPLNILLSGDPGIIFAISTAEAERTLLRGFTTVRDLGGPTFSFKQAVDGGLVIGPRIFPSGAMITTSGGHGDLRMPHEIPSEGGQLSVGERLGGAAIVDDPGELRRRVREQLLQGASQIKLVGSGGVSSPRSPLDMTTFTEADIKAATDVARDWNTYVTIHAYTPRAVKRAIGGGAACIEHAHLIDEETARMFAEKDIWLSTQPFLTMEDAASQTGPGVERLKQLFEGTPRIYDFARRYGLKTAWGSDVLFSPELAPRQSVMLTHLSQFYKNHEVLQMATSVNAELLALSNLRTPYAGRLGVIEKDALADLLVWNGNPLEDISIIENPGTNLEVVVKDGKVFKNTIQAQ